MGAVVFIYFSKNTLMKFLTPILALIAVALVLSGKSIITDIAAFIIFIVLMIIFIKHSIPSIAVILSAFTDIVVTAAIVNVLGVKLSTAGIAAFLMLIGYSVDTDILLTTKLLKRKQGTLNEKTFGAMKTGLTMTATTLVAITLALIFTQSETIRQIMLILLIGLIVDLMSTWIQNFGILWIFIKKKEKHGTA